MNDLNNLGGRRRSIMKQRASLLLRPREAREEKQEVVAEATQEKPKGPKLCPKCGKAKAYYFHTKYCKG